MVVGRLLSYWASNLFRSYIKLREENMHAAYLAYLAASAASIQRCVAALLAAGRGARGT